MLGQTGGDPGDDPVVARPVEPAVGRAGSGGDGSS
jgi:hypothetical protein